MHKVFLNPIVAIETTARLPLSLDVTPLRESIVHFDSWMH